MSEDLPLQGVLDVVQEEGSACCLPSGAADDSDLVTLLNREREILNHRLNQAEQLVTIQDIPMLRYLPMISSDVVDFDFALTRPIRRRDLIFGLLVFYKSISCEVFNPCYAANMRFELRPERDKQFDAL